MDHKQFKIHLELNVKDGEIRLEGSRFEEIEDKPEREVQTPDQHGFLWKPRSDVPGGRGGKPVVLVTKDELRTGREHIYLLDYEGILLGKLAYKPSDEPGVNNDAQHFFAGWKDGLSLGPKQLWRLADKQPIYVLFEEHNILVGPIDPRQRYGSV